MSKIRLNRNECSKKWSLVNIKNRKKKKKKNVHLQGTEESSKGKTKARQTYIEIHILKP